MSVLMTSTEFINAAKNIANNYKTVYANGTVGQPLTNSLIDANAKRLSWYTPARIAQLKSLVGKGYYAFDCSGTIKGILWGWNEGSLPGYGKPGYPPDTNEDGLLQACTNVSTDFSKIVPGAFLWVSGHCGLYIGNKQAIECTPKWQNKVQITNVANLGNTSGNSRTWTKWGKLPWVNYVAADDIDSITKVPPYVYKNVDYAPVFDPTYYANKYADLKKAYGTDALLLFKHFLRYGMNERRQADAEFNVDIYKANYADLQKAYGDNYPDYYKHYCLYGKKEGRVADKPINTSTEKDTGLTFSIFHGEFKPLKRGSTGQQVKDLQTALTKVGYKCTVDGSFGPATEATVKSFQKANKLSVDGVVGPKTAAKLEEAVKKSTTKVDTKTTYKVRVTASALWIRKGPGTNYDVNGIIKDKGTYEIMETKGDWGRLSNGLGWICLKYTQKI